MSTNSRLVIINKDNLGVKRSKDLSKYEINYIHQIILNDNLLLVITDTTAYVVSISPLSVVEFSEWIPR